METVGQRIKRRRKELGLTIPEVSDKTGISNGNLSTLERDRSLPSATALINLSECLNCSIDWILLNKENKIFDMKYKNQFETELDITERLLLSLFKKLNKSDQNYIVEEIDGLLSNYILSPKSNEI